LIALAGGLSVALIAFLAFWPGFAPNHVLVTGNRRVSSGEILRRANIARHVSIWLQNTSAITARIRAIPYIRSVSIARLPPASLTITVHERTPFAILESADQSVVIDRALRVLSPVSGGEALPSFVLPSSHVPLPGAFANGHDVVALRDAYETMAAGGVAPVMLAVDPYGELVATQSSGLRLLLGEPNDLERKVRLINAVLSQVVRGRRSVSAVDVRAPATPVVVYRVPGR
jgi:hypothetical protein